MRIAVAALVVLVVLVVAGPAAAATLAHPGPTRIDETPGRFVPIPETIPHADGAYIDSRLIGQVQWIADHFDVYVTEGFAGPLPSGEIVGCPHCHVKNSEHKIGLAVDLIPLKYGLLPTTYDFDVPCDRSWRDVTRLARWAEPAQGSPVPPFRWVGYEGDANHGCGNHLHLSWTHDPGYHRFRPSSWVELFRVPAARLPASAGE